MGDLKIKGKTHKIYPMHLPTVGGAAHELVPGSSGSS